MPATVTDLAHWRATHPPLLRLWQAQCRVTVAWCDLSFRLGLALLPIPRNRG